MPQIHPRRTRRTLLATIGALAVSAAIGIASLASAADEPFKVGFVYVSPVSDAGWTFQHDSGRKEMEKALGGKVVTKNVENVHEGADAERVISFPRPTSSTRPATRRTPTSASTTRASTRDAISPGSSPAR